MFVKISPHLAADIVQITTTTVRRRKWLAPREPTVLQRHYATSAIVHRTHAPANNNESAVAAKTIFSHSATTPGLRLVARPISVGIDQH